MVDHVKPTMRHDKPDIAILHMEANDLHNEKSASQTAILYKTRSFTLRISSVNLTKSAENNVAKRQL